MILNVQQEEYMPRASETAGVIVVIQDQNTMPFPEDDGISVGPGHSTSIGIQKVRFPSCSQREYKSWNIHIIWHRLVLNLNENNIWYANIQTVWFSEHVNFSCNKNDLGHNYNGDLFSLIYFTLFILVVLPSCRYKLRDILAHVVMDVNQLKLIPWLIFTWRTCLYCTQRRYNFFIIVLGLLLVIPFAEVAHKCIW